MIRCRSQRSPGIWRSLGVFLPKGNKRANFDLKSWGLMVKKGIPC